MTDVTVKEPIGIPRDLTTCMIVVDGVPLTQVWRGGMLEKLVPTHPSQIRPERESLLWTPETDLEKKISKLTHATKFRLKDLAELMQQRLEEKANDEVFLSDI